MTAANNVVPLSPEQAAKAATYRLYEERVCDGKYLNNSEFPELQWSVPGIIPEGYSLLVGSPKVGKSWLVGGLCVNVARGGRVFDAIDVEARPVLLFALEDSDRRLQSRFKKIAGKSKTIPDGLFRVIEANGLNEVVVIAEEFQDRCAASGSPSPLIVIDTLGRVQPEKGAGQSAFGADYQLGSRLQNLSKRLEGTSVIAVHHDNKGSHGDFISGASGTQGVTAACDAILVLKRERESVDATLEITGRDVVESSYALRTDNGVWSLQGDSLEDSHSIALQIKEERANSERKARYGEDMQGIVAAVSGKDVDVTPAMVAEELGIDSKKAGTYLARAYEKGLIDKLGRGRYRALTT